MSQMQKLRLPSIILLGCNAIIGSGIFLLPNKAFALLGPASIFVFLFDMILVVSLALCFAEAAGMFSENGGSYLYARAAFGEFIGFEVGFMKWAIGIIAWATLANGFATALGAVWKPAASQLAQNLVMAVLLVGLGIMNLLGVRISRILNDLVTVSKLLPILVVVAAGIFFVNPGNFTPWVAIDPEKTASGAFGAAAILVFYAFTGFESLAVAAKDMENPKKNLPIAILAVMAGVSLVYLLLQVVAIGVLGSDLALQEQPLVAVAASVLGPFGAALIAAGTLISIGGINLASSFITPRSGVAMAENGILPAVVASRNRFDAPQVAIILTVALAIPIALSGSFATLAAISVVSRIVQYVPTCLAVLVLRRRGVTGTYRVPFGPVIPVFAVLVSGWLVVQSDWQKIVAGLAGLAIGVPVFFLMRSLRRRETIASKEVLPTE